MRFGPVATATAAGAILAHSVGVPGRAMKKGRLLSDDDVAALRAAGHDKVIVARLEPDDVPEDEAATRLAQAAAGDGAVRQAAFTGRCNLYAAAAGIVVLDRARLDRINLIDEAITIATVAPFALVQEGQMLATVKIIPFAAPKLALEAAEHIAVETGPLLRVAPLRACRVGLIMTTLPGTKSSVLDKTAKVLTDRLVQLGSTIAREDRCPHRAEAIAVLIEAQHAAGCDPILVFGASAITDRRDEIPAGIEIAGGTVEHFGMPVDPGNLLVLARLGDTPVLALPGSARSPRLGGNDLVLQRILAGVPVAGGDLMKMGVGGLLKEIPGRPLPRADAAPDREPQGGPSLRLAAIVLAGGQSRRMGRRNKLLIEVDGTPMVVRAVDTVAAAGFDPVIVVTGHQADRVRALLAGRDVAFAHNPDYAAGISTSLRAGINALPDGIDGVLVALGDMPRVRPDHLRRLADAFDPAAERAICLPTWQGKRGNPVLWARRFFAEMADVGGDVGARHIVGEHAELVCEVEMADDGVLIDVDSPEALAAIERTAPGQAFES